MWVLNDIFFCLFSLPPIPLLGIWAPILILIPIPCTARGGPSPFPGLPWLRCSSGPQCPRGQLIRPATPGVAQIPGWGGPHRPAPAGQTSGNNVTRASSLPAGREDFSRVSFCGPGSCGHSSPSSALPALGASASGWGRPRPQRASPVGRLSAPPPGQASPEDRVPRAARAPGAARRRPSAGFPPTLAVSQQ